MRLSAGKCYEIDRTVVRQVTATPAGGDSLATWHRRREDLEAESSVIIHAHHTLTAEENGLWNAMSGELDSIYETIARIDRKRAEQ